jgi:hypothetical protein
MEPRHVHDAPITRDFGPKPADLITRRGQLRASFPSAPLAMVELAARFLTSPGATSDAPRKAWPTIYATKRHVSPGGRWYEARHRGPCVWAELCAGYRQ